MLALRTLADSYPTPTKQSFPQEFIPTEVLTLVLHWDQGVWTLHTILTLRLSSPSTVGQLLLQLRLQFPNFPGAAEPVQLIPTQKASGSSLRGWFSMSRPALWPAQHNSARPWSSPAAFREEVHTDHPCCRFPLPRFSRSVCCFVLEIFSFRSHL